MRASTLTWLVISTTACGRLHFARVPDSASPDGPRDVDAQMFGPWGSVTALGELNTTDDESDPELRGDGLEIVFHSLRPGQGNYDLYHATRSTTSAAFDTVAPLTTLNTTGADQGPGLSGDGLTLLFSDGADIVYATRPSLTSAFGTRQALPALSSTDIDTAPEISADGRIAVVTRGVTSAREMWIYQRDADGPIASGWDAGRQLDELSSAVTDTSADLDDTGLVIYFHSDRMAGTSDDIYVATRASTNDVFGNVKRVDELATATDDGDPSVSADGRIIVFHTRLDLYQATRLPL